MVEIWSIKCCVVDIWSIFRIYFWWSIFNKTPVASLHSFMASSDQSARLYRRLWKIARVKPVFLWFCPSICDFGHIQRVIEGLANRGVRGGFVFRTHFFPSQFLEYLPNDRRLFAILLCSSFPWYHNGSAIVPKQLLTTAERPAVQTQQSIQETCRHNGRNSRPESQTVNVRSPPPLIIPGSNVCSFTELEMEKSPLMNQRPRGKA